MPLVALEAFTSSADTCRGPEVFRSLTVFPETFFFFIGFDCLVCFKKGSLTVLAGLEVTEG